VDLKDIKAIVDLMRKNSISEFELEKEGFKIRLKRGGMNGGGAIAYDETSMPLSMPQQIVMGTPTVATPATPPPAASAEAEINSPMIGTFYRAPSPDAAPYVDVGAEVGPDTVVCIIEAMKVMNEIKAEVKGVITQVQAENGKPVEFGQPLFKIRPT
jgi:acetyl-CoA carboxylase biotin carboxyl carrier protein